MNVVMPQLGETVAEGVITRWYKQAGDAVKADELLFDVETDKVSTEIPAPASGVLEAILVAEGETAKVGAPLAVIRVSGAAGERGDDSPSTSSTASAVGENQRISPTAPHAAGIARPPRSAPSAGAQGQLSPVVRMLIAEHALDVTAIRGTGRDGRVTRDDVTAHIGSLAGAPANPTASGIPRDGSESHGALRRRVAKNVAKAWATAPHVLQMVEADFDRIEQARRAFGARWKDTEGYALTYLPFVARALTIALPRYPRLNATYAEGRLEVEPRINLGIAVDVNFEGLVVPVVKDAAGKSVPELARAINDLAVRARAGKLTPDELTEGTYTVTNNGAYGTVMTAPIINVPQVAILSTDSVRKKPVVIEAAEGDSIAIRPVGVLAQSFDHRALDGAYAASFLRELKRVIETSDWMQDFERSAFDEGTT